MSFEAVLELPEGRFWALYQQIDRLQAEEDMRRLNVSRASQAEQDAFSEYARDLSRRIRGTEIETAPRSMERDPDASKRLAELARKTRGGR